MNPNKSNFATVTIMTGGTLLISALSLHSQILVFNEKVNYFRFIDNKYNPLNIENINRMLNYYKIRLKHRINHDEILLKLFPKVLNNLFLRII